MDDDAGAPLAVRLETAARMLDTSPRTVGMWLRTGRLPGLKVGRGWRVRVSDINAIVEGQTQVQA